MYCRVILKILIKEIKLLFLSHLSFIAILKIDFWLSIRTNALISIFAIEVNILSALRRNMIFPHHVFSHRSVIRSNPISIKLIVSWYICLSFHHLVRLITSPLWFFKDFGFKTYFSRFSFSYTAIHLLSFMASRNSRSLSTYF